MIAMESLATAIAAESDMELIGISKPDALAATVKRGDVDVLITETTDGDDGDPYADLLYDSSRMRVLTIASRGTDVVLHELRPHRVTLGNVSLQGLLEMIRGSAPAAVVRGDGLRDT